jgi:hypothetical protein
MEDHECGTPIVPGEKDRKIAAFWDGERRIFKSHIHECHLEERD